MIVHILRMYNYNHPHTWDESLPYVQNNYNIALYSSTRHSPFLVGLGFQPVGPIDVSLTLAPGIHTLRMISLQSKNPQYSLSRFITSANRSRRFFKNPMLTTSSDMINIGYSFRLETKEHLIGPHQKLCPLWYRPYTITKTVGSNYFELNTPPFLVLH